MSRLLPGRLFLFLPILDDDLFAGAAENELLPFAQFELFCDFCRDVDREAPFTLAGYFPHILFHTYIVLRSMLRNKLRNSG